MLFSCFIKQRSSVTNEDAVANMKEKIVSLPLVPTSTSETQNLSDFLVLLANINESSQHDVVNSFMDSLAFTADNLDKRPTITIFEAPVKKSVSLKMFNIQDTYTEINLNTSIILKIKKSKKSLKLKTFPKQRKYKNMETKSQIREDNKTLFLQIIKDVLLLDILLLLL